MSELPPITRLTRACHEAPLKEDDTRYVPCDDERGESLVARMEREIRRSDLAHPARMIFAGHRGIGKTTELNRLIARLQDDSKAQSFVVLYFDVSTRLDLGDIDFPDILVLIAAELQRLQSESSITGFAFTDKLKNVFEDIMEALKSEVLVPSAQIGLGDYASLAVEFKNRPSARKRLRDEVEKRSTMLIDAVNDALDEANRMLLKTKNAGLVLILDGLERMVRLPLEDGTGNTHDRLFLHRAEQLASLRTHTIYTVPISFVYSTAHSVLVQALCAPTIPVPMIKTHDAGKPVTPDNPGMKILIGIVRRRAEFAEVPFDEVFDDSSTMHYLCEMSGGHPRHLMMFMHSAMSALDELPITRAAAERAVRNYANGLLREIPTDYWAELRKYEKSNSAPDHNDIYLDSLHRLYLFEYKNGSPWYEVNPVLRLLPPFNSKPDE